MCGRGGERAWGLEWEAVATGGTRLVGVSAWLARLRPASLRTEDFILQPPPGLEAQVPLRLEEVHVAQPPDRLQPNQLPVQQVVRLQNAVVQRPRPRPQPVANRAGVVRFHRRLEALVALDQPIKVPGGGGGGGGAGEARPCITASTGCGATRRLVARRGVARRGVAQRGAAWVRRGFRR